MDRIFAKLLYQMEKKLDTMLVTIIADQGSAPRGAGSQMLVGSEGRIIGTIGGGAVEGRSEEAAMEALEKKVSFRRSFELFENAANSIGMACGGSVEVMFQFISAESENRKRAAAVIVERIAERMHLNRRYLSRLFKEKTGYTVQEYIIKVRMEAAVGFLEKGYSVSETASFCGYDDVSNFTKIFKSRMKLSPSEWKKKTK